MALLNLDGFATHGDSTTNLAVKYPNSAQLGINASISSSNPRRSGGRSFQVIGVSAYLRYDFTAASKVIVGFAIRSDGNVASSILVLQSGSSEQISVRVDSSTQLYVSRNGTTLWSSGSDPVYRLNTALWMFIEFEATIHGTTGAWALRLNGSNSSMTSQSSVNTAGAGGTTADNVELVTAQGKNHYFTDFYVCDDSGSAPLNAMLGDVRVDVLLPSADGATSNFTKSSGTTSYELLDEANPDNDSTYIYSNTVNHVTTVATTDLPYTPTVIYGLNVVDYSRKDDSGAREIASVIRHSGTNYANTTRALSTVYTPYWELKTVNPGTSAAFTVSDVNNMEIGVKVIS